MDDIYFERELKNRKREIVKKNLENIQIFFEPNNEISNTTKIIFSNFDEVIDTYYMRLYGNSKSYDEIYEMTEKFKEQLTDDKLSELYNKHNFSQEELDYIKLVKISSIWRGNKSYDINAKYAVTEILLREKIIEQFGQQSLQIFIEILQKQLQQPSSNRNMIEYYLQLLSDIPYGEGVKEKLEEYIEKETEYNFNQQINCGGYALKIDQCIFPTGLDNFNKSVSCILQKFPFIRLLGDKPLEDDEYLVIYRAPKGKNTGHHFIRVDSDAIVREKDASGAPRNFQNWGSLNDSSEAIFAVKKEHKMFGYKLLDVNASSNGLDFEESVSKAIQEKQNTFFYHDHKYQLKKSEQEEIFVIADNEIVAYVLSDDSDCLVEIDESKRQYIDNTSGNIKPIIKDGKLVNYEDFKSNKQQIANNFER